jgi:hypothetical protein
LKVHWSVGVGGTGSGADDPQFARHKHKYSLNVSKS